MSFEKFLDLVSKQEYNSYVVPSFTKEKEELRRLVPKDSLWGGGIRGLNPPRLTTAWLYIDDPLMIMAGSGYRRSEVRDHTFELQQEAAALRGNRKLPKAKVAEALASLKPTEEQTKTVAAVLLALKQIQTVCFNEKEKTIWTMPEDLRAWSKEYRTLWVDSTCERYLDFQTEVSFGTWLNEREKEGWKIEWPVAEGTFEEIKQKLIDEFSHVTVHAAEGLKKPKKEDYAKALGRSEAIKHLS